jgi:hypothetical protein
MDHVLRRVKNKALDLKTAFHLPGAASSAQGSSEPSSSLRSPDFDQGTLRSTASTLVHQLRRADPSDYYRDYPFGNEIQLRDWDTWWKPSLETSIITITTEEKRSESTIEVKGTEERKI